MYRRQLVKRIVKELEKGKTIDAVKNDLRAEGWSLKDIADASYYSTYPEKLRHFSVTRFLDTEVHLYITIVLIGISIFFIALFIIGETGNDNNIYLTSPDSLVSEFRYGPELALANPTFFQKTKKELSDAKADFIEVDLSQMKVRYFEEGLQKLEVPVLTKGRPGSWWETPAGLYKISSKEDTHFSKIGRVNMPWSMNFQGNFYIHGWPYYPDGREVSSSYSGGCVRLSNESAKALFDLAKVGTPILVHEKDFFADNFVYEFVKPHISAEHYLVADLRNNQVFIRTENQRVPIASITKLLTALVVTEYLNLDKEIEIPKAAIVYTSKQRLVAGDKVTAYQLLFPLLLESSNEAAETLARSIGKDYFVRMMNDKAKALGMTNSVFVDPTGAGEGNVSTVDDLFMLAKYITNNRSFIWEISSGRLLTSAYGNIEWDNLQNMNDFAEDESFRGGKVGKTTAAKESGLYVMDKDFGNGARPIVIIVLRSDDRKSDALTILKYSMENFVASSTSISNY
ncbi:MAG: hypothetical protein A3H57_00860 [Candidatus Taylorbacteria bacterium RIFCSPLOWO2_02_FULL_43_11]|uniref:L,D-TPase catalytic domain-containing protein n=1 Tax=Candidatus Taylorbacteria bacterium RIFCSPHIGHO2_02_FULL_43_32b TaxID=1802306 RepID=A0A1G2MKY8_9BACT|nr:MAG: hypothetical protein A2743_03535 [Candidatus Taylorbacteria bacterium RIFCSPHIGHO2_01_FULL_43_47]OHA24508.1 MAG: hypothetical protein A3C72_00985 [Candidatus Taylorbacteria bacterium RIFCSPHIGHO2_02_FULL_43_32b]OHA31822.1 MAG: hypothetical protein A3B08_01280 [Candidatus Taylorbacteria bacterium RIFCSPLOWO2_01_FULL_43_44]OHA36702.1 MAG: hypothetical protein A3H57_00860 [Candidatus Taylorbacteria bacterium RIFCSPLOWO2_02_FULL_43_11]